MAAIVQPTVGFSAPPHHAEAWDFSQQRFNDNRKSGDTYFSYRRMVSASIGGGGGRWCQVRLSQDGAEPAFVAADGVFDGGMAVITWVEVDEVDGRDDIALGQQNKYNWIA